MTKTEWIESLQEYHTLIYVYSGTSTLYEKNETTGAYATYVYGPNGKIAKNVDGLRDYYHIDRLGSTRLVTDESGNTITSMNYSPFGESISTGEEARYLYTGKEMDRTGLYYYGARYYDPEIGRFITRDAVKGDCENPQSLNLYSYCLNNPLRYTDPLGFEEDDPDDIVDEIFKHLFGINLDDLGKDINSYFVDEEGNPLNALDGLAKLMDDLGIDYEIDRRNNQLILSLDVNGKTYEGITFRVDEKEVAKWGKYGIAELTINIDTGGHVLGGIAISLTDHTTVADLVSRQLNF